MILRLVCFISGFLLCNVVAFVGGILAAVPIPRQYFQWFGEHTSLALGIQGAFISALPIFLLCAAWTFATARPFGNLRLRAVKWSFVGFSVAWLAWLVYSASMMSAPPSQWTLGAALLALLTPPAWLVLSVLAAPLGVALPGVFAQASNPSIERTA